MISQDMVSQHGEVKVGDHPTLVLTFVATKLLKSAASNE